MKKFVVLSLISFLILAFGATVYGQEKAPVMEFKGSGWMSIESHYKLNAPYPGSGDTTNDTLFGPATTANFQPGGATFDKKQAYWEQRGRLRFDGIVGKEMTGTFIFEFDSTRWGERSPVGTAASGQRGTMASWDTDRDALEVKNLFMTFGMPWIPIPITIQAGLVPIGVRPRFVFANDGPGIIAAMKVDPATIRLMYFKQIEGLDWAADDSDVYGVDVNAKIGDVTPGVYAVYFKMKTYPFQDNTIAGTVVNYKANFLFAGIYLDGKVGPANLSFDFALDNGKVEDSRDLATRASDVKYNGWATRFDASLPWEKFVFGLVGVYGTGSDVKKTSSNGRPGGTVGTGAAPYTASPSKVSGFITTPGDNNGPGDLFVINGHPDFLRGDTGFNQAGATQVARSYFGGLWYAKLYGAIPVTDMYKVTLAAAYIGDTTKNGNSLGNARKSDGYLRDDKSIGFEFDLLNTISLYKNLTFDIGFGYLVAGKGLDYYQNAANPSVSPKNPWILGTRLAYSF